MLLDYGYMTNIYKTIAGTIIALKYMLCNSLLVYISDATIDAQR